MLRMSPSFLLQLVYSLRPKCQKHGSLGREVKEFEGHATLRNQSGDVQWSSYYKTLKLREDIPEHKDGNWGHESRPEHLRRVSPVKSLDQMLVEHQEKSHPLRKLSRSVQRGVGETILRVWYFHNSEKKKSPKEVGSEALRTAIESAVAQKEISEAMILPAKLSTSLNMNLTQFLMEVSHGNASIQFLLHMCRLLSFPPQWYTILLSFCEAKYAK